MITKNPYRREIPDYYDTMFMDGYEQQEILAAAHKRILAAAAERNAQAPPQQEEHTVNVVSNVEVKK